MFPMILTRRTVVAGLAYSLLLPSRLWAAQPLRVGVIGAGSLGGTVGRLWIKSGHEVMFSSRHSEELLPMAKALGPKAFVGTALEAAAYASVLLFAVPYEALPQLGKDLQGQLKGKVVLDACNPAPGSDSTLTKEAEDAGVALTSAKYLPGARLVRAFSAVDTYCIESSANHSGDRVGIPIASDDSAALQIAAQLVLDAGCDPVSVGDLASARSFQRGGPGFRANTSAAELRRLLGLREKR